MSYTTPGTYVFDPRTLTPPHNSGDVLNFTTINICRWRDSEAELLGLQQSGPVVGFGSGQDRWHYRLEWPGWLQSIEHHPAHLHDSRCGGYPAVGSNPAGVGLGPGAGGRYCIAVVNFTGNQFLVPLVGGSGGAGNSSWAGGAGGGAILLVSNVSITGVDSILANGGGSPGAGGGACGGIRLVAPTVTISGPLSADLGPPNCVNGNSYGIIRIEASTIGALNVSAGYLYTATPYNLFVSGVGAPAISVPSVTK